MQKQFKGFKEGGRYLVSDKPYFKENLVELIVLEISEKAIKIQWHKELVEWYLKDEKEYEYEFEIPYTEDFKFIYIGIENKNGDVLYRKDLLEYQENIKIQFKTLEEPHKWVYWVYDNTDNWINRKDFTIN